MKTHSLALLFIVSALFYGLDHIDSHPDQKNYHYANNVAPSKYRINSNWRGLNAFHSKSLKNLKLRTINESYKAQCGWEEWRTIK